jgi:hypothetical protein
LRAKDNYIEKFKALLDRWNAEFDQLEAIIGKSGAVPMGDFDSATLSRSYMTSG